MLSYILPVEEKPPAGKERLQLQLASPPPSSPEGLGRRNRRAGGRPPSAPPPPPSLISKESSTSSFASSDMTGSSMTPTGPLHDKPKHKLLSNGGKHTGLKRVSFGSSKGSMVETLIFESPLAEEVEPSPGATARAQETNFPYTPSLISDADSAQESEREKVRVSFYQGARPQCVSPPPPTSAPDDSGAILAALLAACVDADMAAAEAPHFNRQISTESGWDNPFRPDGDLSREADEIVNLIKGGKPITPTPNLTQQLPSVDETDKLSPNNTHTVESPVDKAASGKLAASPKGANGTKNGGVASPGAVEVQRSAPPEPQQAEHIVLKKKPKCKCCVVQ